MADHRDPASNQLINYKKDHRTIPVAETTWGKPIVYKDASLTVGKDGPMLLQDNEYIDEMTHFNRERIPERVVHAKGAGAFGEFVVTNDIITKYCASKMFNAVGKKTPMFVRFSQVSGESGSSDTVRDPRGFALKFWTEEGVWDLVGNNTPIFFIRDAILFPSFIHTQKRNPVTHIKPDYDAFWDFASLRPESTQQYLFLFSDRGIPLTYRHMHGYGSHTFKLINDQGVPIYCKFHYRSDQGVKNMPVEQAAELASSDPDYHIRDLYNAIATGNFPSWTMSIQVMTFDQAKECKFNPFDLTKVWPTGDYPLIEIGKFTLNKNSDNYFNDVEQVAFAPSNLIPGIEPSPDKMLQGRLFAYTDTHLYRLGTNYIQMPINCPFASKPPSTYSRDGAMNYFTHSGAPNYHPNSFNGPDTDGRVVKVQPKWTTCGDVFRYDSGDEDNYSQSTTFYEKVLDDGGRQRLISNIVNHLKNAATFIQERIVKNYANVSTDFANKIEQGLINARLAKV